MDEQFQVEQQKSLREYLDAFGRRKWPMLLTMMVLFAGCAVAAIVMPPVYRSTATILIEEQEIPQDLVRTTISSYADQRIQVISQQVMTRANLTRIVDKYDLYPRDRNKQTSEEIVSRMRRDIKLEMVNADVIDRRSGAKTNAMIAFKLSYESESGDRAQKVANELTSLYLNENLQLRQQKTADTSKFLAEEAARLEASIVGIEDKLARFKSKNVGRLPDLAQVNMQMRDRTEGELLEIDRRLSGLEERRFYLESQLAQIKPNSPIVSASGERIPDPEDRLRTLRAQYAASSGIYSQRHPDMVRMRQQMEALEREGGSSAADGGEEQKQLVKLQGEVTAMRDRYSDEHPDVLKLKARIAALERQIENPPAAPARAKPQKPENPTYIALQVQLESIKVDARSLQSQRASLRQRLDDLDRRIAQTPSVERDYLDLARDRENAVARYREIKGKLMDAEIAQELEKDRKSERFSLIDPPVMPQKPVSPNRPLILLMGAVLALAGGGASVGVLEALDKSVHNARELSAVAPLPLLSVIPYIGTPDEAQRSRARNYALAGGAVAVVMALLAGLHLLWMPLDTFWFALLRRFDL